MPTKKTPTPKPRKAPGARVSRSPGGLKGIGFKTAPIVPTIGFTPSTVRPGVHLNGTLPVKPGGKPRALAPKAKLGGSAKTISPGAAKRQDAMYKTGDRQRPHQKPITPQMPARKAPPAPNMDKSGMTRNPTPAQPASGKFTPTPRKPQPVRPSTLKKT